MNQLTIDQLTNEIDQNPSNAEAYYQRGILLAGRYIANHECTDDEECPDSGQAIQDFEKVIELTPDNAAAYYHKACIYFALDIDDEEAENLLQSALELDKENTGYLAKYAEVISYNGENSDTAVTILRKVIEKEPAASHYYSLGINLMRCAEFDEMMCDLDSARSGFQEAIECFEKSKLPTNSDDTNEITDGRINDCQAGIARL